MSFRKFQCLVRKTIRALYKDPLVHLIVDFLVKNSVVEAYTFAFLHKIEGKNKQVQAALNKMRSDGLLNMIEMRTEQFKVQYSRKLQLSDHEFKNDKSKSHIYYFNVDLKFILKARAHLLSREFDEKIRQSRQQGLKYKCYSCEDGDEHEYFEVDAISMQWKCNNCRNKLGLVEEKNKLTEEDQNKCRLVIDNIKHQLKLFDNYVVPANFFGPGNLSAYVSPTTTQQLEDLSNVNFDLKIGNEFHGFIKKRTMKQRFTQKQLETFCEELPDEINYYFAKEVEKRQKTTPN